MARPRKRLTFKDHALIRAAERKLDFAWMEQVALRSDWTEVDRQTGVTRHYGVVAAAGGKVLLVAIVDANDGWVRVISAQLDRNVARKRS